jgi:hypothetical protein
MQAQNIAVVDRIVRHFEHEALEDFYKHDRFSMDSLYPLSAMSQVWVTGGNIKDLSLDQLYRLMTVTQHVTDLCLNELEHRGELTFFDGKVIVPYQCDHLVETVLTRGWE